MATRTIATDIKLTGEKEFNDGMKAINSNLKNLRTDMAAVTSEFDGNADSVEALTAKQKILRESVDQHRAKVDALRQMYEKVSKGSKENSALADEYRQKLNQATVALNKEVKALEENTEALDNMKNPIRNAVSGYTDLIDKLAEAKDKVDEFVEKHKKSLELLKIGAAPVGALGKGALTATAGFVKLGAAATAASAAVGTAAVTTMVGFAKEAAESARAAAEAGETLTATQQQWLAYSNQLEALDGAAAKAKGALAGILLPALQDLSSDGSALLDSFASDMEAAAGNAEKQGQIIAEYVVKGAQLIKEKLPEYIKLGKELLSGLGDGLREAGPDLLDEGGELIMELLDEIISAAPQFAEMATQLIQKMITGFADQGPELFESAIGMVVQIVSGLAAATPDIIVAAAKLVMSLIEAIINCGPQILDAGRQVVSKIRQGISEAWKELVSWFNNLWDNLFSGRDASVNIRNGSRVDGSYASGLDYVPRDGFIAELHKGEMVLNRADANAYRSGQGSNGPTKVFNMTINAKSLTQADMDMVYNYMNGKLGEDL